MNAKGKTLHEYDGEYAKGEDGCNDTYFNHQVEGICYAYAVIGLMVKGLRHDKELRDTYPSIMKKMYERMHQRQAIHAGELAGVGTKNCRMLIDKDVWDTYRKMQGLSTEKEYSVTSFEGGNPVRLLAAILLHANPSKSVVVQDMNVRYEYRLPYTDVSYKVSDYDTWKHVMWDEDKYCIVHLFNKTDFPAKSYSAQSADGHVGYDLTTFFPAHELDKLREKHILSRWVGGFIYLYKKPHDHVIVYIICKGKLIVCDSQEMRCTRCTGSTDVAAISSHHNYERYSLAYVFTPSDKIGPAQFNPEEVEHMKMFELQKQSDYAQYSGDLKKMATTMLEEGVPVRTNDGVGYTVSRTGDRVVVDLISAGRQEEYNIDELKHVSWEDRVRKGEFRPLKNAR